MVTLEYFMKSSHDDRQLCRQNLKISILIYVNKKYGQYTYMLEIEDLNK